MTYLITAEIITAMMIFLVIGFISWPVIYIAKRFVIWSTRRYDWLPKNELRYQLWGIGIGGLIADIVVPFSFLPVVAMYSFGALAWCGLAFTPEGMEHLAKLVKSWWQK